MDGDTSSTAIESAYSSSASVKMSAVVACTLAFSLAVVFCFAICICCSGAEGADWVDGDTFLDDLLRMQICAKVHRVEELIEEEAEIRAKLLEEGGANNAQLKKRLQKVTAKLQRTRRRLESLRREAEATSFHRRSFSQDEKTLEDFQALRCELIAECMKCTSYEAPEGRIESDVDQGGPSSTVASSNDDDDTISIGNGSVPECSICLNEYQEGDLVAESRLGRCSHQFHKDCIVLWLRKHSHCPLCRTRLLEAKENQEIDDAADAV